MLALGILLPLQAGAGILQNFTGKDRSLNDYTGKGKWLVVMIWASDCRVCNIEVGQYIKFHRSHRRHNATMLGISIDGAGNKKGALALLSHLDNGNVPFNAAIVDG